MLNNVSDTLRIDTAVLNTWRADDNYDYAREMVQSDFSLREWIYMHIDYLFSRIFGSRFYSDNVTFIWCSVGIVLIAAVAAFIYYKKPALFGRGGKTVQEYEVTEDTIYGIDFPEKIALAMERHDYREAVRLTYLYALKELSDAGRIDWQPYKTPSQYTAEIRISEFRTFSNHFLHVRYGNFSATEELAYEMQRLRIAIMNAGGNTPEGGGQ